MQQRMGLVSELAYAATTLCRRNDGAFPATFDLVLAEATRNETRCEAPDGFAFFYETMSGAQRCIIGYSAAGSTTLDLAMPCQMLGPPDAPTRESMPFGSEPAAHTAAEVDAFRRGELPATP